MELFHASYCNAQFDTETRLSDVKNSNHFIVDDLLDFPSDENVAAADGGFEAATSKVSSVVTAVDQACNSSFSNFPAADFIVQGEGPFAGELCVPYDDMAELEWLSTIVEESFTSEDLQKLHLIQGVKARSGEPLQATQYPFQPEATRPSPTPTMPAKARSKRSRAGPGNWTSRLAMASPPPVAATPSPAMSSSSASGKKMAAHKNNESLENSGAAAAGGDGRKCLHCATEKTPQWRTGPMGPKTLCNACGVRYKSGRLVPEYRPAASPTFMLRKHSNSHRKVMELRRQKEVMRAQQKLANHHRPIESMMLDVSKGDDYFIHQHIGPCFQHMI